MHFFRLWPLSLSYNAPPRAINQLIKTTDEGPPSKEVIYDMA
jgi:hypothetical protein